MSIRTKVASLNPVSLIKGIPWYASTNTATTTMEDFIVIRAYQWITDFIEASVLKLSVLFLMIGFITGTVAVLSPRFQFSANPTFNFAWSVIQAVSLDGLLFGIWFRFRDTAWSWLRLWYALIGALLGVVAFMVMDTLSYQELRGIPDVSVAMTHLGINQVAFTDIRSALVVLVSILVSTLPKQAVNPSVPVSTPETQQTSVAVVEPVPDTQAIATLVEQAVSQKVGNLQVELTEIKSILSIVTSKVTIREDTPHTRVLLSDTPLLPETQVTTEPHIAALSSYTGPIAKTKRTQEVPIVPKS
jgi:hypothetical protein